jgi:hypothetical protein
MSPDRAALSPQRTDLAWRRTALAATVTGLLAARGAMLRWPAPVAAAAVVLLAAAIGAIVVVGRSRATVLTGPPVRVPHRRVWIPTVAVVVVALLGLATVVSP